MFTFLKHPLYEYFPPPSLYEYLSLTPPPHKELPVTCIIRLEIFVDWKSKLYVYVAEGRRGLKVLQYDCN